MMFEPSAAVRKGNPKPAIRVDFAHCKELVDVHYPRAEKLLFLVKGATPECTYGFAVYQALNRRKHITAFSRNLKFTSYAKTCQLADMAEQIGILARQQCLPLYLLPSIRCVVLKPVSW